MTVCVTEQRLTQNALDLFSHTFQMFDYSTGVQANLIMYSTIHALFPKQQSVLRLRFSVCLEQCECSELVVCVYVLRQS